MLDKGDSIYEGPAEADSVTQWRTEDRGAWSQTEGRAVLGENGEVGGGPDCI